MPFRVVPSLQAHVAASDDLQPLQGGPPGMVLSRQSEGQIAIAASGLEVAEIAVNLGQIEIALDDAFMPLRRFRELDGLSGGGNRFAVLVLIEVDVRDQKLTPKGHMPAGELLSHRHRVVK